MATQYGLDLGNWTTLRRMYSNRALLERMTEIWSGALHIPVGHDRAWVYRTEYDATIRRLALGRIGIGRRAARGRQQSQRRGAKIGGKRRIVLLVRDGVRVKPRK